ncbi:galactose mutarotase [Phyllobacterium sp. 21LDTY02-6]|uniref:aldose epimerase family protein n=1 Tax=Phyllobacterium sp. 21LDTY02-6 TaxID=2944903 RepID=UPI0020212855|nr:aldose epimerase family protein [Phyllobacterium sp. 21LDTY02-6]MCO4319077.1 galactose mutarotase [Phyllobacterium sp. 21LDTY02-6]
MAFTTFLAGSVDGQPIEGFDIARGDTRVRLFSYGAVLNQLWRPDRKGCEADIVLGYDQPDAYVTNRGNAGAVCGRHANRLAAGQFTLDGVDYQLACNDGAHHLHGGPNGFGKRVWRAVPDASGHAVRFELDSPHGDEGYPGHMTASVTYALDTRGDLGIHIRASSDRNTIVNLVHHGYWNLTGHDSGSVLGQHLRIAAGYYTPVDADKIPLGTMRPVSGTPFNFRTLHPIGDRIEDAWPGGGYDHNFCLDECAEDEPSVEAWDPVSGRAIAIHTNQPGLQFYTANHFGAFPATGKGGAHYDRYAGFALETQGFPNSPNVSAFPSTVLTAGETYRHDMLIRFSLKDVPEPKS